MEDVLRQFYHEIRHGTRAEAPLLTPRELVLKGSLVQCIKALSMAREEELVRLVQVLRAEGLQITEPSIRREKFLAAATALTFEPLAGMFGKL
jgi:hypothetical protein